MRARHKARSGNRNRNGGGRSNTETSNQLAFNVICLAVALNGAAHTEECKSKYED